MQPIITPEYLTSQGLNKTFNKRFWSKVFIMPYDRGCWLWLGTTFPNGYGAIKAKWDWKCWLAHRAAWTLCRGPIPEGMLVCHTCDNPPCVNPDHLFLGTHLTNSQDKASKGRWGLTGARGESNGNNKVDPFTVIRIRWLYSTGLYSQDKLAKIFGTCQTNISSLVQRKTWPNKLSFEIASAQRARREAKRLESGTIHASSA